MSIRYLKVADWSVMCKQIQTVLSKLPDLREVRVLTPAASSVLTPAEEQRLENLYRIDAELHRNDEASL